MFADEIDQLSMNSKPRIADSLTLTEKIQKAKEMRAQGASIREISRTLGVSTGTVVNYLKGYPYKNKEIS
jgi:DNA-binding CsgD family transcriptional regulator